ncbi:MULTISPECIES: hypothetical protein [Streptomycetaceae]|uniref:Uncharacterized protein n=1 Tax=Streptantibioticus cattleyicolor (strain ATCC 35852 / DSM 46488 / JCM 4925 / NBRC 14057 / NRRL 8057) TaxID=1003195 RepID=F8JPJ0_STREN|nr:MULTISPECIES: hypothetical protein [Streptomycetaceae]AEW97759.1 hypothetical protein SCATT_53880 [Streptantibioticus cattleyicolor NRRL 8057 = DSM 46488]MYS62181.1 hypothetical protein [Streptomyces sp. SID5468]CCB78077.1 conserved protein of unknown function [Streptantibioticus cattleyicolor NRRL 8057 = DSM 46488]
MRAVKRPGRNDRTQSDRTRATHDEDTDPGEPLEERRIVAEADEGEADAFEDEGYEIFRVFCPDCSRPIALFTEEERLPEHALCSSPWDPFGLTVCAGSGRPVAQARPAHDARAADEQDLAALLTLPAGLDWRTQPFSHVGGVGSQPMRAGGGRVS